MLLKKSFSRHFKVPIASSLRKRVSISSCAHGSSFLRKQESRGFLGCGMPAFAGMTEFDGLPVFQLPAMAFIDTLKGGDQPTPGRTL